MPQSHSKHSSYLRGPLPEPPLAPWWSARAPAEADCAAGDGDAPGGMLWPVHSALLAAASCSRRLSASSLLRASSAFSCPAASSRACRILTCVRKAASATYSSLLHEQKSPGYHTVRQAGESSSSAHPSCLKENLLACSHRCSRVMTLFDGPQRDGSDVLRPGMLQWGPT